MAEVTTPHKKVHEVIMAAIRIADTHLSDDEHMLAFLITSLPITEGFDDIIEAWNRKKSECPWWGETSPEVIPHLLQQKESTKKEVGVSLVELEHQTRLLFGLLTDRHPGLTTWNEALKEQLEKMHRLTSQALGL